MYYCVIYMYLLGIVHGLFFVHGNLVYLECQFTWYIFCVQ